METQNRPGQDNTTKRQYYCRTILLQDNTTTGKYYHRTILPQGMTILQQENTTTGQYHHRAGQYYNRTILPQDNTTKGQHYNMTILPQDNPVIIPNVWKEGEPVCEPRKERELKDGQRKPEDVRGCELSFISVLFCVR